MPDLTPEPGASSAERWRALRRARAMLRLHARAVVAGSMVLGILLMVLHWR
jgi:hypothetical protein